MGKRWRPSVKTVKLKPIAFAAALAVPASVVLALSPAVAASAGSAVAGSPASGPPSAPGKYTSIVIPHGSFVQPEDISDSGVIVGCYLPADINAMHGFIDKGGKFSFLADPAAGASGTTCATGINDAGVIVGWYYTTTAHGFLDRHGTFTTINAPGAGTGTDQGTFPLGINKAGEIVGYEITGKFFEHGFVLKNGKFTTIDYPVSAHRHPEATSLDGIGDDGTVSGVYAPKGNVHSFLDQAGKFLTLTVPGAERTFAGAVSETGGYTIGTYQPTSGTHEPTIGFTYIANIFHSLRDPAAPDNTFPQGVNGAGKVVGYYLDHELHKHGFLFTPAK
jgi:hypothetical protein